ncbi:MAG TPA: hypothetical protein VGB64_03900 [Actinomycetota bacterium]
MLKLVRAMTLVLLVGGIVGIHPASAAQQTANYPAVVMPSTPAPPPHCNASILPEPSVDCPLPAYDPGALIRTRFDFSFPSSWGAVVCMDDLAVPLTAFDRCSEPVLFKVFYTVQGLSREIVCVGSCSPPLAGAMIASLTVSIDAGDFSATELREVQLQYGWPVVLPTAGEIIVTTP